MQRKINGEAEDKDKENRQCNCKASDVFEEKKGDLQES